MIIKGKSRAGARGLGQYLSHQGENERVQTIEVRGTIDQTPAGAIQEMDAYAAGTRCEKPLYHAILNPDPKYQLSPEQRLEAVDALEEKLGLDGHARVVVLHQKEGREHLHIVWSRIDLERMRSVSDSHNYRKHEEVARDLERRFGHERIQGAHHEREGVERPDRTPSRAERQQEEKTGITGKQVKAEVTAAFRASDGPEAFRAALEDAGYLLAQGDRRDHVIVDREGGIHSLARRLEDTKAAELRAYMSPIDRESLPSVEQAQAMMAQREREQELAARDTQRHEQIAREKFADEVRRERMLAIIERGYSHGDGYVNQSHAAQRDFERRSEALNADPRPKRPEIASDEPSEDLDRFLIDSDEREATYDRDDRVEEHPPMSRRNDGPDLGDVVITERMQRLLDRIEENRGYDQTPVLEDRTGPQREAPGKGRTRSR